MIPISRPIFGEDEKKAVMEVLDSGILTSSAFEGGPKVREFENVLAQYMKVKYAVAVNSGTASLESALIALDIRPGDEVLVPSFTFTATANAVVNCGARPIFVDIDPDYVIDVDDFTKKITDRCKAVIPVHLYGYPANMDPLLEIAQRSGLAVIEDAAQSLGATYKGMQTGSLGDIGCFSLYPSKIVTSGEGGVVTTNSKEIFERLRMIRNHGAVNGFDTSIRGHNLRMPEISAAIASSQMKKLDYFIQTRRQNALKLESNLSNLKNIILPKEDENRFSNMYLFTIAIKDDRDRVMEYLHREGIDARIFYRQPVHLTPLYRQMGYGQINLKNTSWAADHVLSLPVHPAVSELEVQNISSKLIEAITNHV